MNDEAKKWIRNLLNKILKNFFNQKIDYDDQNFKSLREEIKTNQEHLEDILKIFLEVIEKSNCIDRLTIVELIDYFFNRCHKFREELLNEAREFVEITCETDIKHRPLPGTKKSSSKLKIFTIEKIKKWNDKYGKHYPILKLVVEFLKSSKSLDYESVSSDIEAIRKKNEFLENRRLEMTRTTLNLIKFEFSEIQRKSRESLDHLEQLLEFLVPRFDRFHGENEESIHEMRPGTSSVEIVIEDLNPKIEISEENDVIIQNILELKRLIQKNLEKLTRIPRKLADIPDDFRIKIRSLRTEILQILSKIKDLNLPENKPVAHDDDDEFEDVEEMTVDQILMIQYSNEDYDMDEKQEEKEIEDSEKPGPSGVQNNIPTVPYGLDLMYWGEQRKQVQIPKNNSDCHRFWRPPDEESSAVAQECVYTQRVFNFVGEQKKSGKICRAPMPNGLLCPREDFKSCPIHGLIVTRDEKGEPISSKDKALLKKREEIEHQKEVEKFSRKIEEKMNLKKKRRRKYEVEEVSDSKKIRTRLEKKLLDPKTVRRVSQVLDASRKAKIDKQFGQQFSHL